MAGRKSSLLTANKVLLIAVINARLVMVKELVSSATGSLGKLSGFSPITLYLPLSLVISTAKFLSMVNVSGWSGMFFSESINILAGMHTRLFSWLSTSICTRITVSRSVAMMFNFLSVMSNKKSSNIGSTVLALITPLICCRCLSNEEDDTINFISLIIYTLGLFFSYKLQSKSLF